MIFGISIHALLAESDSNACCAATISRLFLSTLSLRRATYYLADYGNNVAISIHALLAESDGIFPASSGHYPNFYPRSPCGERLYHSTAPAPYTPNFYPRSPCGERRYSFAACSCFLIFLSTLSLRRATINNSFIAFSIAISIHALLAESDWYPFGYFGCNCYFYPRSPCGERPVHCHVRMVGDRYFYPRSPCGERRRVPSSRLPTCTFLSTLSLRRATTALSLHPLALQHFYPRSPCGERPGERHANSQQEKFLSTLSLRRATRP